MAVHLSSGELGQGWIYPVSNPRTCPHSPSIWKAHHCSLHDFTEKNKLHLTSSTNHRVGWRLLKSNEPSSQRVHSQKAPPSASLKPTGDPGEFWRPDLSLQRKPFTRLMECSVAVLIQYVLYSELSLSVRSAELVAEGEGKWYINNENAQKLVLLPALLQ